MGTSNSDNPKTLFLPHCWICECKFVDTGGTEIRHEHHIVPRAYGGVDGPTVTLCDTHHSKVHRLSEALMHKKPHFSLLQGESKERSHKMLYLANVIKNAWLHSKDDPNKSASVMLVLNQKQKLMIDRLKSIYPATKSRPAVLALALQALYNKHFTD